MQLAIIGGDTRPGNQTFQPESLDKCFKIVQGIEHRNIKQEEMKNRNALLNIPLNVSLFGSR